MTDVKRQFTKVVMNLDRMCAMQDIQEFIDWLTDMMNDHNMNQGEIARKGGITSSAISLVLTGARRPGVEVCRAIAKALDLPEIYVFSQAGLLTPVEYDEVSEEFRIILHELSAAGKRDLMQIAHMILKWEEKARNV